MGKKQKKIKRRRQKNGKKIKTEKNGKKKKIEDCSAFHCGLAQ